MMIINNKKIKMKQFKEKVKDLKHSINKKLIIIMKSSFLKMIS